MVRYFWELIKYNPQALVEDFEEFPKKRASAQAPSPWPERQVAFLGPEENLYIAPTAKISPFVLLDATKGPIYIGEEVFIAPHTTIEGPAYIGPAAQIVGAKIRPECSIGAGSRIGGEVEASIIHGFSNKYHLGFLGHSYLGEWVNVGALTTSSDLKNDYSTIEVWINGRLVDSGEIKVGSFIGDHTKLGIGTLLNTGTSIGVSCNVLPHGELLPKFFPSFTCFLRNKFTPGMGLEETLKTVQVVMARRGAQLTPEEVAVLEKVYELTEEEREKALRRRGRQ
jgi:UDP-N-acetylglucosamine diphosphorylase/glucosamine-1-phosphate N-acetyltransferase